MGIMDNHTVLILAGAALLLACLVIVILVCRRQIRLAKRCAQRDPLTGALSAAGFCAAAQPLLDGKRPQYAVVTAEISNLLQIQQTFGDTDRVLNHVCRSLKAALGNAEPLARLDGNTFSLLMKNREEGALTARLQRIYDALNSYSDAQKIPYRLDLVFGIYLPADGSEPIAEMLQKAGDALRHAPETERFRFSTHESNETAASKWELVEQMDLSLQNEDFVVYLQPKVRIGDTRIVGAEALIRWRHPRRGMLTPEMFIPPLEEYHMMPRVDRYLFESICKKLAAWTREGKKPCPISVNFSLESLLNADFGATYAGLCREYGLEPELIEFELSENLLYEDPKTIKAVIEDIHEAGFQCSLDHFGRTFIPLHLLRELEVDAIKLDSSLFSAENNSRRNRFVIEAILKLASQMNICTVAEGIDNASQVQYLQQAACNVIQGFFYFRPMSPEEFKRTAYQDGELRYVNEKETRAAQPLTPAVRQAHNNNVVMFSLLVNEDQIIFSSCFSPLLEGQVEFSNASALFAHTHLIHENDRNDFFHLLERCAKDGGWVENTLRFLTSQGHYEWLEVYLHREYAHSIGENIITGTLVNIAGWKNEVDRWKEKANRDALTGLYNREYFEQFAINALKKNVFSSAALIFVDVDNFKQVNDTLGHTIGDDILCFFAKRLLGVFRHTDVIARYGGDEFVVFANGISRADLEKRLTQLCEVLRYPYRNGTIEYRVSGSIGAALCPDDGTDYRELLEHADSAVYTAKEQGRDQFVLYQPGMENVSRDR